MTTNSKKTLKSLFLNREQLHKIHEVISLRNNFSTLSVGMTFPNKGCYENLSDHDSLNSQSIEFAVCRVHNPSNFWFIEFNDPSNHRFVESPNIPN